MSGRQAWSCSNPACLSPSHCGWSVVLDLNPDEPPCRLRHFWNTRRTAPNDFIAIALGLVPSSQIVHRAELCAIIRAVQVAARCPDLPSFIGVDSASALRAVQRLFQGLPASRAAHRDLLRHLPECSSAPSELRSVLGNSCADAAVEAPREADMDRVKVDAEEVARMLPLCSRGKVSVTSNNNLNMILVICWAVCWHLYLMRPLPVKHALLQIHMEVERRPPRRLLSSKQGRLSAPTFSWGPLIEAPSCRLHDAAWPGAGPASEFGHQAYSTL